MTGVGPTVGTGVLVGLGMSVGRGVLVNVGAGVAVGVNVGGRVGVGVAVAVGGLTSVRKLVLSATTSSAANHQMAPRPRTNASSAAVETTSHCGTSRGWGRPPR